MQTADDHPELTKLLIEDVKGGGDDDDETGRSGLGISKKSNRSSKSGKKIPKSFTIDIPKDKIPKNSLSPQAKSTKQDQRAPSAKKYGNKGTNGETSLQVIREQDRRNMRKMNIEFEYIQRMLDGEIKTMDTKKKKKSNKS